MKGSRGSSMVTSPGMAGMYVHVCVMYTCTCMCDVYMYIYMNTHADYDYASTVLRLLVTHRQKPRALRFMID